MTGDYSIGARAYLAARYRERKQQNRVWIADVLGKHEVPAAFLKIPPQTHDAPTENSEGVGAMRIKP